MLLVRIPCSGAARLARCSLLSAVTLFEGGRVYGAEVINELIFELHASVAMSEGFEGEMKNLANYARWVFPSFACGGGWGWPCRRGLRERRRTWPSMPGGVPFLCPLSPLFVWASLAEGG